MTRDIPWPPARRQRYLAYLGLGCCAAALLLAWLDPAAALAAWLAAFVYWSSIPIGGLALAMMMRLIPGAWTDELAGVADAALLLLPLAMLAALPILLGLAALYAWTDGIGTGGFRAVYLSPWPFVARTVAFFAGAAALAWLLRRHPGRSTAVSAAGLILFALLDTMVAVDWLMSLEPRFHSSGFGLYVMSCQMTVALTALVIAHLVAAGRRAPTGALGGLVLCALLLWAYFAFMQYFIIWSGNAAQGAVWYRHRAAGGWSAVEYAIGALHLAPAFLLVFPPVRHGRLWLLALAGAVLVGKALEAAWLVLPSVGGTPAVGVPAALAAFAGLGALSIAGLAAGRRRLATTPAAPRAMGSAAP